MPDAAAEQKPANDAPVPERPPPEGEGATPAAPGPASSLGDKQVQAKGASAAGSVVGDADAPEEKAADSMADEVMRMPDPAGAAPAEKDPAAAPPAADAARAPEVPAAPEAVQRKEAPEERQASPPPATPASEPGAPTTGAAPDAVTPAGTAPLKATAGPPTGPSAAESGTPAPPAEPPAPEGEQPARSAPEVPESVQEYLDASRGKGAPLPEQARRTFEAKFQRPFDDVTIHDDGQADDAARKLDALAFTRGTDIYFRSGAYDPASEEGKRLLAHELAHVVQQRPGVNRKAAGGLGADVIRRKGPKNDDKKKKKGTERTFTSDKAPKGTIDLDAKTVVMDELDLGWKAKAPFVPSQLKWRKANEARPTDQRKLWWENAALKSAAATGVTERAAALKLRAEPYTFKGPSKSGASNFAYLGSAADIGSAIVIPSWNRSKGFGRFDVDHMAEWQLGGENTIENLWLLDPKVNSSSGAKIRGNIYNQLRSFLELANKELQEPQTPESLKKSFTVTWSAAKGGGRAPTKSQSWARDDIGTKAHVDPLAKATKKDLDDIKGTEDRLVIYPRAGGGQMKHVSLKGGKGSFEGKATRGYELKGVSWTAGGPSPGSGQVGSVDVEVFKDSKLLEAAAFSMPIMGMPGVDYGGTLDRTAVSAMRSKLVAKFASPITFPSLDFDLDKGLVGRGAIPKPEVKLLEKVAIDVVLEGEHPGVEATIVADDLALPGPFKVQGGALTLGASAAGLTAAGRIDFEIEKLATGYVQAGASMKAGGPGLALEGGLSFDTEMFDKAEVKLSYKDGKWGASGTLEVGENKVKGIKSATATVGVSDETVTADGSFETSIKGVKKGTLGFKYDAASGMAITGLVELGELPGIKGGKLDATVRQGAQGWSLSGGVSITPNIPGIAASVTGRYDDGAFAVEGTVAYARGIASGSITVGVTNAPVGEDGKPAGAPQPDGQLTPYGQGSVTLKFTEWLQGKVGLKLKPNGEIEVSGEVALPKEYEVFPEKRVDKRILSIGIDIPIVGVAVAGQRIGIFATIRGGVSIGAGFGPGKLKDVALGVTYNPDHPDDTKVTGTGTFEVPASAGLKLQVDGGIGAGIPVVSATAGISVFGELGLAGAASASAKVEWTPRTGVVLDAKGDISVQPKFRFGVDAFVDVSADLLVDTVELYHRKWSLASFEYGSDLTFGVTFPIHYESGKPFAPSFDDMQWKYPEINPSDLLGGLMKQLVG